MIGKVRLLTFVLIAALLLSVCGGPGASAAATELDPLYAAVLEQYYNAMYADWYLPLTPERLMEMSLCPLLYNFNDADRNAFGYTLADLNGDGIDELFLGRSNDAYMDTIYQLFTIIDGELSIIFTADETTSLYLLKNGRLLYTFITGEGEQTYISYRLGRDGYVYPEEVYSYDPNTGSWLSQTADGNYWPLDGADYDQAVGALVKEKIYFTYASIHEYFNGPDAVSTALPAEVSGGAGAVFNRLSLTDAVTGLPTVNVLVPAGWSASLNVSWQNVSTNAPGLATVSLRSPDGLAEITMISNQDFADISSDGVRLGEGADPGLYMTLLRYRSAQQVQALYIEHNYGANSPLLDSFPLSDSILASAESAAKDRLQSLAAPDAKLLGSEGTAARCLYAAGEKRIEMFTVVTAAHVRRDTDQAELDSFFWNIPITFVLTAQTPQAYEQAAGLFETVAANSDFTKDFLHTNLRFGEALGDLNREGLLAQAYACLQGGIEAWESELQSSPDYDAGAWAEQWSGVIREGDDYRIPDGGSVRAGAACEGVFQDGSYLYMGPVGDAPDGWTRLEKTS